jgi:hypothetical protein
VILEANDSATEEREHAIDGNMDVKTSGESTAQLLGCMVEAPLVGREMASWLCTEIAGRRRQTKWTFAAVCRGGGQVAGA